MGELELTNHERSCLQQWFRQAIAKLEQEEVVSEILAQRAQDAPTNNGHRKASLKRPRRRIIDRLRSGQLAQV